MPGTLTHYWVLWKVLKKISDNPRYAIIKDLKNSNAKMIAQMNTDANHFTASIMSKYKYENYKKDSVLASFAYAGSVAPDLFYIPDGIGDVITLSGTVFADLMHYNKTSSLIIFSLKKIKQEMKKNVKRIKIIQYLDNQLAYKIGHITHIAADAVIHPFINSMAGAYHLIDKKFTQEAYGLPAVNSFNLHNKLEHFQDKYVSEYLFGNEAINDKKDKFKTSDWEVLNFPRTFAEYLTSNSGRMYIVDELEKYYKYKDDTLKKKEQTKLGYFISTDSSDIVTLRNYEINVLPSRRELDKALEKVIKPDLFKKYIDKAVDVSIKMIDEAMKYVYDAELTTDPDMYEEKKYIFRLLRKNWNLDCGVGFEFSERKEKIIENGKYKLHIPVQMHLTSKDVAVG